MREEHPTSPSDGVHLEVREDRVWLHFSSAALDTDSGGVTLQRLEGGTVRLRLRWNSCWQPYAYAPVDITLSPAQLQSLIAILSCFASMEVERREQFADAVQSLCKTRD